MSFFDSGNNKLHFETDQMKRQKSALSLKLDFLDSVQQIGKIKNYDISLNDCTCVDFSRRHKPCKHMYCLAMALGIFEVDNEKLDSISDDSKSNKKFKTPSVYYEYSICTTIPSNFVVIDFETANQNPDSICQMGLVTVKNNTIVDRKSFLICPPYKKFTNTNIHGLTFSDVRKFPTFGELWTGIKPYLENQTITAYNLFFDWGCLLATLNYYQFDAPAIQAFDVLANVRCCSHSFFDSPLERLSSLSLSNVASALGFKYNAHDALSDSEVTAKIQFYLSDNFPELVTNLYVAKLSTMIDKIISGDLSLSTIVLYCIDVLDRNIDYDTYKNLFKLIEQIAAQNNVAELYKCCGLFYERFNKIPRAVFLYKKSLELDSTMRLKSRIQKLEKTIE